MKQSCQIPARSDLVNVPKLGSFGVLVVQVNPVQDSLDSRVQSMIPAFMAISIRVAS